MGAYIAQVVRRHGPRGSALAVAWLVLVVARGAGAQAATAPLETTPARVEGDSLTLEMVERRLKELDALPGLDDAARGEIRGLYEETQRDLTAARDADAARASLEEQAAHVDERLEAIQSQLAAAPPDVQREIPPDATLAKLEERLSEEIKKLEEAKRQRDRLAMEQGRRQTRRAEIPGRLRELQEARAVQETDRKTATTAEAGPKTDAHTARRTARQLALDAETQLLQQELATYVATADLLPRELDLANREVSLAEKRVAAWRQAVETRRAREVTQQARAAQSEAAATTGPLRPLAVRSAELADRSGALLAKIQTTNRELENARALLERMQQQFKSTQEKVKQVGLNYTIGLLLRREETALPDVRTYRRNSRERAGLIRDVQLEILDLAEERARLTDVDFVDAFLSDLPSVPEAWLRRELEEAARDLVNSQLQTLATLQQNLNGYFDRLVELESTERQLVQAVTAYQKYIDEHVLWIQSSDLLSWDDLRRAWPAVLLLLDASPWWELLVSLAQDFREWILPALLVTLLWLLLLMMQPRLRQSITQWGEQAASGSCRRISITWGALVCTTLIAATWPLLLLWLAWRLAVLPDSVTFAKMVSAGLRVAAVTYLVLEFLRQVCRTQGLAQAHFHWPDGVRATLRGNLRWLMAATIPLIFLAATLDAGASRQSNATLAVGRAEEALSRLCTVGALLAALVFVHRVLRPQGPFFAAWEPAHAATRLFRFRHAWYALALGGLTSLLTLSVVGYHYTVFQLGSCVLWTVLLLEIGFVTAAMVDRWLVIARRRLAIERAQQRRASGTAPAEAAGAALPRDLPASDLHVIGEQSRQLLHAPLVLGGLVALWFIWIDVLPALGFLERFELWHVMQEGQPHPITLNRLIIAGVIFLVTLLATKNIPGLLELAVLSRLPVDPGTRYAVITVCRYVIIIVGLIVTFGWIGVSWASYQWLVAAGTVGLGFGLQEIFANFVSGLIVLFEQPIRVGDVVTIGDVTGVVSRIHMRATTVTNWDHQDFIVPNKEFITGRLLNWTLTNTINRVVINVGVAYDSDPDVVHAILLDVLRTHPLVMDDPAPSVTFSEFGDSTLNYILRGFLPSLDDRLTVIHELHAAIQRRLTAAGVAFAFPTREIHIRSVARGRPSVRALTPVAAPPLAPGGQAAPSGE
ncbi:MAG: mechanosensitive ion channel [Pirellulaceae bacterium]|nr:mechanosensitive ion channel [Pirellulaceae bacterium]